MTTAIINEPDHKTFNILARNVPPEVWARARQNAKLSKLTFNDYLIRLYAQSQPLSPAEPSHPTTARITNPDNPTEESAAPSTKQP
jgi:hypothetical protein